MLINERYRRRYSQAKGPVCWFGVNSVGSQGGGDRAMNQQILCGSFKV